MRRPPAASTGMETRIFGAIPPPVVDRRPSQTAHLTTLSACASSRWQRLYREPVRTGYQAVLR
jgi:hypothetical protein